MLYMGLMIIMLMIEQPVFAATSGDYEYTLNADNITCTITNYSGAGGDIAIPSTLDTYTVTVIGKEAFRGNLNINNITIPNSVATIGAYAFRECINLSSIIIPNSVTAIQNHAFLNAENLNNVTIPNSVTFIGFQGFSNCYKLTNITIPNSVTTIEGAAFSGCRNLSSITIPNSITSIEGSAFKGCTKLKNITIPNSVTSIKSFAFSECDALESITIPQSVVSIETAAFYNCDALKSITIPQSVMSIGNSAFFWCLHLTSVYFDGKPSIGTSVFKDSPCTFYSSTGESFSGISCTTASTYSITVNSLGNGSITPSTLLGMKNQTISLQIIPSDGYTINLSSLKYNDGAGDVIISGTSFVMPDKSITISGEFKQIPVPIVTTPSAATDNQKPTWSWTNATGEGYYRYKLNEGSWTYTPFTSFTPTTNLIDGTYTLFVQQINNNGDWSNSGSAEVTITTPTYNVGVGSLSGGSITASKTTAKMGDTIELEVNPDLGKKLKAGTLKYNDGSVHDITGTNFTMPAANVTITAEFEDIPPITYTVSTGVTTGGAIYINPSTAKAGDTIYITVTPNSGKQLKAGTLKYNGVEIASGTTFAMPATNVTVTAEFEDAPSLTYTVNTAVTTGGIINITSTTAKAGDTINLTILPSAGKQLKAGTLKYNGIEITNGISFVMPAENVIITAEFEDIPIVVTDKTLISIIMPSDITGIANGTSKAVAALGLPSKITIETDSGTMPADVSWYVDACPYNASLTTAQTFIVSGAVILPAGVVNTSNVSLIASIKVSVNQKTSSNSGSSGGGGSSSGSTNRTSTNNSNVPSTAVPDTPTPGTPALLPTQTTVPAFDDTAAHWAKDDINFVVERGLLTGTSNNRFSPNAPMTRGMFVTALGRLAKINAASYNTYSFTDVKAESSYAPYIEWAAKNKIVFGTGSNQFNPDKPITREEMAVIMTSYAKLLGYDLPVNITGEIFADSDSISTWAKAAVKAMQQAEVLRGKPGNYFIPKDTANRAEASAVLHRFIELIIEAEASKKA